MAAKTPTETYTEAHGETITITRKARREWQWRLEVPGEPIGVGYAASLGEALDRARANLGY